MESRKYVWVNGVLVESKNAKVHVLTHSLQYGSGIFEGIRSYSSSEGTSIFRLKDHMKRFENSARIYSMNLGFTAHELEDAVVEIVRKNKDRDCYIRPFAFVDDTRIGLGTQGKKISVVIASVPFGSYFDDKEKGVKCVVSSWRRINSSIMPPEAKASANYLNSSTASLEAKNAGADEAILLSSNGYVAEGPGENIFLVNGGKLLTPSKDADILLGITRDTIIKLAEFKGIEVEERNVHREELYTADEMFFAGTAAEITHITSVDKRKVGNGKKGPITRILAEEYSNTVHGKTDFKEWLTEV